MKRILSAFLAVLVASSTIFGNVTVASGASEQTLMQQTSNLNSYVLTGDTGNDFGLVTSTTAASIYVDFNDSMGITAASLEVDINDSISTTPASLEVDIDDSIDTTPASLEVDTNDSIGMTATSLGVDTSDSISIKRAVNDFKKDIVNVTGVDVPIVSTLPENGNVVIVGTIGSGGAIDELIANEKLDVSELKNEDGTYKWEGFIIDVVENPFEGIDKALVIAGCDRRGTIFGLYDISEKMGVSPWYYFADVPIAEKDQVYIKADTRITDSPDVQYRGIFINDEEKLNEWSKFHKGGTIGPAAYAHIFELLLRLKANYLWPAMHVNGFNNDPENARLAEEYGIVMGSSHCEQFLRNNNMEWPNWKTANNEPNAEYDYTVSPQQVLQYWRDSTTNNKNYESQWTVGMRGAHDEPFTTKNINNGSFPGSTELDKKVNLLGKIIQDQQAMMREVLGEEEYQKAFQMLIPYKEVLPLYNAGLEVPDNVTTMWVDDNHGYVRRLPNEAERQRSGGHGLYYHVSYWAPADQSYLWFGTAPLALMGQELQKSYESGIQKAWILNVGDIKPLEGEMEFFIKYGWDVNKYENNSNKFLQEWMSRDFGTQYADEVTDIVNTFYQLTRNRRPEHMRIDAFDQLHYGDEATKRMLQYQDIFDRANEVYENLPSSMKDGFYEQVLCKIRWAYYVNKSYYYADRSNMAYDQGRLSSANNFLKLSQETDQMKKDEIKYYNNELAGGKWDRLLDPEKHSPPVIPQVPAGSPALTLGAPEMGAIVQGEEKVSDQSVVEFSEFSQGGKYIDIFNKGAGSFEWTASTDKEWIKLSKTTGTIIDEERIWVNINSLSSHKGEMGSITLKSGAIEKTITVNIKETAVALNQVQGYAEADGYVSMEAEHYSRSNKVGNTEWQQFGNIGRTKGDVMRAYNPSLTQVPVQSAPSLEYDVQFESAGNFPMEIYRVPTLNAPGTLKFAVSIDNGDPIVVSSNAVDEGQGTEWVTHLFPHIEKHVINVEVPATGKHTVKLWMIDNYIMIDKMVIYTDEKGILYSDNGPDESYHSEYNNTFSSGYNMLPRTAPVAQTPKNETTKWGSGAILEKNGKLFIEPEVAIENSEYAKAIAKSGNAWRITQSDTGYAMRLPDQGVVLGDAATLASKNPEMQFKTNFSTAGDYNVWMRVRFIDNGCDSIYGGIDGKYQSASFTSSTQLWSYENDEKWTWIKVGAIKTITAGDHTLNIWMREDGISVDRIYLTKGTETPSDGNWVVSERALANDDSISEVKLTTAINDAEGRLNQAPVPVGTSLGCYGQTEYDLVISSIESLKNLRQNGITNMTVIDNAIETLTVAEFQLKNSQNLNNGAVEYVTYQDFESNELGKLPYGFNVEKITNGGAVSVVEENGNRFVRFTTSSTSGSTALLQLPFGENGVVGEEIIIEMRARMPQSALFTNLAYIWNGKGYPISAAFDRNTNKDQWNVMIQNGSAKTNVSTFEDNKWYDVKFIVNSSDKTFSAYIDNQLVAENYAYRDTSSERLLYNKIGLDGRADGIYDVDDMKVYVASAQVPPTAVESVTLDKDAVSVVTGEDVQLTATVSPIDATNKAVMWATSDATVATVNQLGIVTAIKAGTATITVTTADGSKTATCVVTVEEEVDDSIIQQKLTDAIDAAEDRLDKAPVPVGNDLGCYGQTEYEQVISLIEALETLRADGTKDMAEVDNAIEALNAAELQLKNSQKLDDGDIDYIVYQDLESNELNKLPYGFDVLNIKNGGAVNVVEEDGNRFVRFTTYSTSGSTALLQLPFGANGVVGEELIIEMRARMPQSASFTNLAYISNGKGYPISAGFDKSFNQGVSAIVIYEATAKKQVGTFEDNKWYDVKFVVNSTTKTFSAYIDNTLVAEDFAYRDTTNEKLLYNKIGLDGKINGVYDVDDMKVYLVPTQVPPTAVESVTLDKKTASVKVGQKVQLTATVSPADADNKEITWSTSDVAVATVDEVGKVTAIKAGTATITVTTADGSKTAICVVTVEAAQVPPTAVESVTLDKKTASVKVGQKVQLTATVSPDNATNKEITWSTSNAAIATVDQTGKVATIKAGTATITVRTTDGGKTATCVVTVTRSNNDDDSSSGSSDGDSTVIPAITPPVVTPSVVPTETTQSNEVVKVSLSLINGTTSGDGVNIPLTVKPYIEQGRTMAGIRDIANILQIENKNIVWNNNTKEVTIKINGKEIKLILNQKYAMVDGKKVDLDVALQIKEGRTVLPIAHIARILGMNVTFDTNTKEVIFSKEQ
ncbi:MAG: Ig domain protein group 2 domain protein [Anaerocolumna sp.]|nr:Ig domain protein group 2 domain protein [Anaerocolumna sp.]